jgi:hypothetical protein
MVERFLVLRLMAITFVPLHRLVHFLLIEIELGDVGRRVFVLGIEFEDLLNSLKAFSAMWTFSGDSAPGMY